MSHMDRERLERTIYDAARILACYGDHREALHRDLAGSIRNAIPYLEAGSWRDAIASLLKSYEQRAEIMSGGNPKD